MNSTESIDCRELYLTVDDTDADDCIYVLGEPGDDLGTELLSITFYPDLGAWLLWGVAHSPGDVEVAESHFIPHRQVRRLVKD